MNQVVIKNWRQAAVTVALAILFACVPLSAAAQQLSNAERATELTKIRNELRARDSFRNADAVVVISERAIADAVRQFVGLEIVLANGSVMKLTSIETQLVTGAAIIKIGVQSKSVNLQLSGLLTSGQVKDGRMRMPFRVTEVKLLNGLISSVFIKTLFGTWLKPETWNDELPSLDLPLEINETMEIPASRFNVEGQMPMEIATADYHVPLKLSLTSLLLLDRRAVLVLQVNSPAPVNQSMVETVFAGNDQSALLPALLPTLLNEIHQRGANLAVDGDVRLRLGRNIISSLLSQIAGQQNPDLKFKMKQSRLRSNEVKTVVSIVNYTDITNGDGQADISEMRVESIADSKVNLRLSGQGVIDAQIKGREYGIPYGFSPRTNFEIKDQPIPLQFVGESGKVILRAVAGSTLPINLRFSVQIAGQEISVNRTEAVQVDRWLNRIELPALLNREILLPRRLEVDDGGNLRVTQKDRLSYALSNLRVGTSNDAIEIAADVKINPR